MNRRNPKAQILPALLLNTFRRSTLPPQPRHHKPSLTNHLREILLLREPLNTLHKVLITIPVRRNNLPNQRDRAETPPLVDRVEQRVVQIRREFQAGEHAAGFEHAVGFAEGFVFVREVPDTKGHGVEIDAGIRDGRQAFSVGFEEVYAAGGGVGRLREALAALGEHFRVDIRDGDVRGGVAVEGGGVVEHAHGDVAGAAGDVEDALLFTGLAGVAGVGVDARVEAADEVVFPEAVDAQGHEVVHGVVAAGDGGEDGGDWRWQY
jgi:hypothetical protein